MTREKNGVPGTILHIDNLSKSYGHIKAVQNLALSIDRGNVFGILGPNGSGKTTTLSVVLGIVRPDAGHFTWFEGVDLHEAKKRTGSLVETPNFYPYLSGEQNLKIVCDIRQVPYEDIDRVLKIVNLHQRGRSKYFTYSYGMKQRLALASLLLGDPEVLILDEPTNGLDPEGIAEVRRIISAEAEKGKTVIMASHILDEVEKVCSHVAILKKGELVSCGRVSELLGKKETVMVSCRQAEELHNLLLRSGFATHIERKEYEIFLSLHEQYKPEDINEFAFKNGIILNKIVSYKKSLESQFLELVK